MPQNEYGIRFPPITHYTLIAYLPDGLQYPPTGQLYRRISFNNLQQPWTRFGHSFMTTPSLDHGWEGARCGFLLNESLLVPKLKLMLPAIHREQDQNTEKTQEKLCDLRSSNGHSGVMTLWYVSVVIWVCKTALKEREFCQIVRRCFDNESTPSCPI